MEVIIFTLALILFSVIVGIILNSQKVEKENICPSCGLEYEINCGNCGYKKGENW